MIQSMKPLKNLCNSRHQHRLHEFSNIYLQNLCTSVYNIYYSQHEKESKRREHLVGVGPKL